ncbi:TPA: hypothetical protein HA265_00945 [Candidatus Woesearchaeota archaeon]|nr:hypothetical protein [Candidatus Woesearchaeota archaeon]
MKYAIIGLTVIAIIAMLILGCAPAQEEAVTEPAPYQPPVLREQTEIAEPESVPVPSAKDTDDEQVRDLEEEEKQLELGSTEIKEVPQSLLSDVNCTFIDEEGEERPYAFAFRIANMEEKEWIFAPLSYGERSRFENPIISVNALQVTNGQLVAACGKSRLKPGESAMCQFALEDVSNTILRKSLRKGETAAGNQQVNSVSLRTAGHAAEIRFFC